MASKCDWQTGIGLPGVTLCGEPLTTMVYLPDGREFAYCWEHAEELADSYDWRTAMEEIEW